MQKRPTMSAFLALLIAYPVAPAWPSQSRLSGTDVTRNGLAAVALRAAEVSASDGVFKPLTTGTRGAAFPVATLPLAAAARDAGIDAAASIFTSQSAQCEIPGFPGNAAAFDPGTTGLSYCPAGWDLQIRAQALDAELWRCGLTLKVATTPQDAQQLAGRLRNACERTNAMMDAYERSGRGAATEVFGVISEEPVRRPSRDCRCPPSYFQLANSVGTGEGFYGGPSSGTSPAGDAGTGSIDGRSPVPPYIGGTPEEQAGVEAIAAMVGAIDESEMSLEGLFWTGVLIAALTYGLFALYGWIDSLEGDEEEHGQHNRWPAVGVTFSWQ